MLPGSNRKGADCYGGCKVGIGEARRVQLATYRSSEGPRAGLVVGEEVFDAAKLSGKAAYSSVLAILEDWKTAEGVLKAAAAKAGKSKIKRQPVKRTKFLAPVQYPSAIFCAGANYADHAAEMAAREGRPPPPDPHTQGLKAWHFLKATRTFTDPATPVKISDYAKQVDWEIELVAVIGKVAKRVPLAKALSYVAPSGVSGKITIGKDRNAQKSAVIITIKDGAYKYAETIEPKS